MKRKVVRAEDREAQEAEVVKALKEKSSAPTLQETQSEKDVDRQADTLQPKLPRV